MVPAIDALPLAATLLRELAPQLAWGPTGSVGLELASGAPWATYSSDLDLMLRADYPVAKSLAQALHRAFAVVAVRLDLLIETPLGGVSLADWALHDGPWLLRTNQGPRLVNDPWGHSPRPS